MTSIYAKTEQERQAILDHGKTHDRFTSLEIAELLKISRATAQQRLYAMEVMKEVERIGAAYRAIADKTRSADECRKRKAPVQNKARVTMGQVKNQTTGRYIHSIDFNADGTERRPIKNQEGQSSGRREFGIQATAGLI